MLGPTTNIWTGNACECSHGNILCTDNSSTSVELIEFCAEPCFHVIPIVLFIRHFICCLNCLQHRWKKRFLSNKNNTALIIFMRFPGVQWSTIYACKSSSLSYGSLNSDHFVTFISCQAIIGIWQGDMREALLKGLPADTQSMDVGVYAKCNILFYWPIE